MKKSLLLSVLSVMVLAGFAVANPTLQIYLPDGIYDTATESWVINASTFSLWVVGTGNVYDVKLAAAYAAGLTPTISITSTKTGDSVFTDPSQPSAPSLIQTNTAGVAPKMGDGSSLATHGIYGSGTWWQEFYLGDFVLEDSPVADFIGNNALSVNGMGQINAYTVTISGASQVHFDAYDHVVRGSKDAYVFAPFSHDADGNSVPAPLPVVMCALGLGLIRLGKRWVA